MTALTALSSIASEWVKRPIRKIAALPYRGEGRFCPVCETHSNRFRSMGRENREDAQCPHCSAVERHRFLMLYLRRKTTLFNSLLDSAPESVLHVSPARCLESRIKAHLGSRYLTADLFSPHAMVKMDIMDIHYPPQSFDAIICSHVLEHVESDRKALAEFYRVLKDDGWAILLVPITSDKTFEDPSVTDSAERLKAFGEVDHLRRYGPDYVDRLRAAGFTVAVSEVGAIASTAEITQMGLTPASGEIYFCTK